MSNIPIEDHKSFWQNDRLLVCGMLVFYGLCFVGLSGGAFWWVNQRGQARSAASTATASGLATEQVQGTATAAVRATALASYEIFDPFDTNVNEWRAGPETSSNWTGSMEIKSGAYIWRIRKVDDGFIDWADFPGNDYFKNYDASVDTRIVAAGSGDPCSGLLFRKAPLGWDTGGYSFLVCHSGYFSIYYYNYRDGWSEMHSEYHSAIHPEAWNRLEVQVRDTHFEFRINDQLVYETDDERQPTGGVALAIDAEQGPAEIWFDNFAYQHH